MVREITDKEVRQMQMIQLEILLEVDRICELSSVKYGIDGGTFLGAVRHKGFIPWDPDIDVIMLRSEYEKFFSACKRFLNSEKYFLQEERTDPEYRWGFTKIRKKGTVFIREGQEHLKMKNGVFIDVLIMDNVPDNYLLRKVFEMFCAYCRFVMWSEVGKLNEKKSVKRLLYKLANNISVKHIFRELKFVRDIFNKKPTRYVRYMTCRYTYNKNLIGINSSFFESYQKYIFENHEFPAFVRYDEYLTLLYGDYMKLPPLEKRKSHMPVSKIKL